MGDDLWPAIPEVADMWTPAAILREQASFLSKKTNNLVEGRVVSFDTNESGKLGYVFNLYAPSLDYSYRLLVISHAIEMYPLILTVENEVFSELDPDEYAMRPKSQRLVGVKIGSEAEFLDRLRKVFGAEKTRRIIAAMQVQSRGMVG